MSLSRVAGGADLLQQAYTDLDFEGGTLLTAGTGPRSVDPAVWQQYGDWLMLAHRVGAERVFFVGDDPVVVFSTIAPGSSELDVIQAYRRAWSLSRPRCLFLAIEDELRVYALTSPPVNSADAAEALTPLEVVHRAADVAVALAAFSRDNLETGVAFESGPLSQKEGRADTQLIADVRSATNRLIGGGLTRATAHTLIERAILIRYLEDRGVLLPAYFQEVAKSQGGARLLTSVGDVQPNYGAQSTFATCLADRDLTSAVFDRLAHDFNGDLFLPTPGENEVAQSHLVALQSLLDGTTSSSQEPLFLWAYDFSVVPTSLISAMYEMFHREELAESDSGTYYTPPELVEFVLSQTLVESVLDKAPKICDPACGSGIFLVEAFHLVVRHEMVRLNRRLRAGELRRLLLDRIAGIDVDEQAVRLAAFSLYLALLNYQTPQDIRSAGPLPQLIYRGHGEATPLVIGDAFGRTTTEASQPSEGASTPLRPPNTAVGPNDLPWPSHHFDVVVGNPPWTEPSGNRDTSRAEQWTRSRGYFIGDRSPSQQFMWRAHSLLSDSGVAALLVGATAFHNKRSRRFRAQWLGAVQVLKFINFTLTRSVFFSGAIAPFSLVIFRKGHRSDARFAYLTARPSVALTRTRSLSFGRFDRRVVAQSSLLVNDYLWKLYSWGNHHDAALVARLDQEPQLDSYVPSSAAEPGFGYQYGKEEPPAHLLSFRSLRSFEPWGPLQAEWFEAAPTGVKRQPNESLYSGRRLLVRRGVRTSFGPVVRLEDEPAAFRHTIYSIPLGSLPQWRSKVLLAILLSSLGRYWMFMKSGSWGIWHDSLTAEDILAVPVRDRPRSNPLTQAVIRSVDRLRCAAQSDEIEAALAEVDQAVESYFDLMPAERDLIADFWASYAEGRAPRASVRSPQRSKPLVEAPVNYVRVFLDAWQPRLGDGVRLVPTVVSDRHLPVAAVIFELKSHEEAAAADVAFAEVESWRQAVARFTHLAEGPGNVLTFGVVRAVTDTAIIVVKRAEPRLWTASAAREDAEAALVQAMALRGE